MPKIISPLTETQVRNAKPKTADYKMFDGGGLHLLIRKSGTKVWQFSYSLNGKRNVFTIGTYSPTVRAGYVGLADARQKRDEAKHLVKQGHDPNKQKQSLLNKSAAQTSFEAVAREWHEKQVWTPKHAAAILRTLETDVFPRIGAKSVEDVSAADMVDILRTIESRGALDVAKRVNQRCEAVFDYAINLGLCENNPATGRSKFLKSRKVKHRPHLDEADLPEFGARLKQYQGGKIVKMALQLLALTFVRPGELRFARWDEINEEKAEWRIPAERMKMARPHIVPLSPQALNVLKELRPFTQKTGLLFPGSRAAIKPISDVTLLKALKIMGYVGDAKIVPHGFRATASTILNERGHFRPDVIERQLAHVEKNKVRAAYHHAEYLQERYSMMQWWGNFLQEKGLIL